MSAIPQDNEEAVEMAVDYEFDINTLPPNLRNIFPKKFVDTTKAPGKKLTKLKKGEQGLRVQTNETLQMSRCTFERDQEAVEYIVPTPMLKVGAKTNTFRNLAPPVEIKSSSSQVQGATSVERFIRKFWDLARQQRNVLASLGLNPSRRDRFFGDATFARNVNQIVDGEI
ncbi:hypothetical protein KJ359_000273 [Pestalotiopsis sp. 9143b]|nr:hypothetical protein KJ359_000273 [Pestalotiopsis sp. 9143b]